VSGKHRDGGTQDTQHHAAEIEILLEFINETLIATV
jgi:hypothetical protein